MRAGAWLAILVVTAGVAGTAAWVLSAPRPAFSKDPAGALEQPGDPAKGQLVFAAGDCASCHASPGQPDRLRLGGGLALASPFGTFRVPNISMDPVDGIGTWRTIDLANALLSGVSPDGSHYYPVFPYPSFAKMQLGDVRDLMAYLRTLPAVAGRPPPHDLALPFRIRRLIGFWKLLFFDRTPVVPDPNRNGGWNRGQYLVEAMSHCDECHSSRNVLGAIKPGTRFAGGEDPEGVGFVPNITPTRIGAWKEEDIAEMLKSGNTPDQGRVGASMSDVVTNTAMLPQSDRDAIAAYIKSLPARPTPRP
ncbi:MAG TPA: cytochrome c [Acetobacteraceae bacterium]|jgi:mono/diheme cytochrome c family protein|nr:cytochrome c [Acetobacteraceae bacterium]